jgi:hypothetical protein
LVGALVGHVAFIWIARQGFYALLLPGFLAGIGGGLPVKDRSILRGTICGVIALAAGLFSEWRFAPFMADTSLGHFITHIHQLRPITLLMIAAGTAAGFWFSYGREKS